MKQHIQSTENIRCAEIWVEPKKDGDASQCLRHFSLWTHDSAWVGCKPKSCFMAVLDPFDSIECQPLVERVGVASRGYVLQNLLD